MAPISKHVSGSPWRIVFFGTPSFAVPALHGLFEGPDEVVAVVTQPDRKKGRGQKVLSSPVKELALGQDASLFQPDHPKDQAFQRSMRELSPDLVVVVAYGHILPESLLKIPAHGAVNVHASLLPAYRGAAPIPRAILKGETATGITTILMDAGMDTGDILLQVEVPIAKRETHESLRERLALVGTQVLLDTVVGLKDGTIQPVPQDHSKATYAPGIHKAEGQIDWGREAEEIDRQVRAFNPWPGAFTKWEGHLLKIYRGEVRAGAPGRIKGLVSWVSSEFIQVDTGKDVFLVQEVQVEGRRRMSVKEFLAGHPISIGTVFV